MLKRKQYYLKYGLAVFILLLVSFFCIGNVSASNFYTAYSGTGDTTDYTLVETLTKTEVFETNKIINWNISTSSFVGKDILIQFDAHPSGGDTRDVYLLEYPTHVVIPSISNGGEYQIFYNGILSGEVLVMSSSMSLIFYGQTPLFEGLQVKLYKSNKVPDTVQPIIDTEKYIYITSVDSPTTIANMQTAVNLTARDEIDGDLTSRITIVSDGGYSTNVLNKTDVKQRVLGDYAINFEVTDNSGNKATATITIRVVDTTVPVINTSTSTLTYNIGYSGSEITDTQILNSIYATDNFSTNITKSIIQNNYTNNKNKVGSYTVVVQVTDSSGNYARTTVTITVYDNVKPVFTGSNSFYKSYDVAKSVNDIIAFTNVKATDEIDGQLTIGNGKMVVLTDNYSGNANKPGTYAIVLRATDIKGNYADFTITVTVADEVIPFFLINKNKVVIESGVNFNSQMLVQTLKDVGVIDNKSLSFTVINDTYTGNETEPGLYNYDLKVLYNDGVENVVKLEVEVLENNNEVIDVPEAKSIFKEIGNFFVKIGKWINIKIIQPVIKIFKK